MHLPLMFISCFAYIVTCLHFPQMITLMSMYYYGCRYIVRCGGISARQARSAMTLCWFAVFHCFDCAGDKIVVINLKLWASFKWRTCAPHNFEINHEIIETSLWKYRSFFCLLAFAWNYHPSSWNTERSDGSVFYQEPPSPHSPSPYAGWLHRVLV